MPQTNAESRIQGIRDTLLSLFPSCAQPDSNSLLPVTQAGDWGWWIARTINRLYPTFCRAHPTTT
ncbi:hypothetical protein K432DRAFT_378939 [Lepidopterella palustris CBS 459.81]|uniref:Uncharacterized protein n=1 Tax=Lepidopterella palustris CBS 459.81 TaxID=1314670 RepID=A0A8E2JIU5_9PEZI|nr:hypothetical protein K432DRAFT_378939 [Lepidopterella palustris CBS 459.81]